MTQRITEADLESKIHRLNEIVFNRKVPPEHFAVGKFHLYHAYGKVQLHQCKSTGGQIDDVFRCGFFTKRELYEKMDDFISGIILTNVSFTKKLGALISGILFEKHKGE